jgi:hypothetical protein
LSVGNHPYPITSYQYRKPENRLSSLPNESGPGAFTIRNHAGYTPNTTDSRARIFLNPDGFENLQYTITHEFIHIAGCLSNLEEDCKAMVATSARSSQSVPIQQAKVAVAFAILLAVLNASSVIWLLYKFSESIEVSV